MTLDDKLCIMVVKSRVQQQKKTGSSFQRSSYDQAERITSGMGTQPIFQPSYNKKASVGLEYQAHNTVSSERITSDAPRASC